MVYDYLIAGSGIAGSVCAYELSKLGYSCLILEKHSGIHEKICGGGVSYKAVRLLNEIGIDIQSDMQNSASIVTGHITHKSEDTIEYKYSDNKVSLGIRRALFDGRLLHYALKMGAEIEYNQTVDSVNYSNLLYHVNSFCAKKFICAVGARGLTHRIPKEQSVGVSAQIMGISTLCSDRFNYWYFASEDSKYFWIFPIGNNLWNIGIWSRTPYTLMKKDFEYCVDKYVNSAFKHGFKWVVAPSISSQK